MFSSPILYLDSDHNVLNKTPIPLDSLPYSPSSFWQNTETCEFLIHLMDKVFHSFSNLILDHLWTPIFFLFFSFVLLHTRTQPFLGGLSLTWCNWISFPFSKSIPIFICLHQKHYVSLNYKTVKHVHPHSEKI